MVNQYELLIQQLAENWWIIPILFVLQTAMTAFVLYLRLKKNNMPINIHSLALEFRNIFTIRALRSSINLLAFSLFISFIIEYEAVLDADREFIFTIVVLFLTLCSVAFANYAAPKLLLYATGSAVMFVVAALGFELLIELVGWIDRAPGTGGT